MGSINTRTVVNIFTVVLLAVCLLMARWPVSSADSLGTYQAHITPFAISGSTQQKDGTVYVININDWTTNKIYKTVDQGATWTYVSKLPGSTPLGTEKMFCTSKNTLLVADGDLGHQGHIFRSVNSGASWTNTYMFSNKIETVWAFFEDANGNIYASVYSSGDGSLGHAKLLRSRDDGASWQQIANWQGYRHCHAVFVNKYNGYIYVALGDGPFALMRSKDNGRTWTNIDSKHLWVSFAGKGDSKTIYLGTDETYSKLYRFTDDGSSTVNLQTVYDYGNSSGGYLWFLRVVNGKLVFGTTVNKVGAHVVLGVSDANWNTFNIVKDIISTEPWQGFWPVLSTYWNITKLYAAYNCRYGIAFKPSTGTSPLALATQPPPPPPPPPPASKIFVTVNFQPLRVNMQFSLTSGAALTIPADIVLGLGVWAFQKWADGSTNRSRTFTENTTIEADYTFIYLFQQASAS